MIPLLLSLQVVLIAAAWMLGARIGRARRETARALSLATGAPGTVSDSRDRVRRCVEEHADATLLPASTYAGLAALPVLPREHHDPYRNVADLLRWIGEAPTPRSLEDHAARIKALYQLQHSLELPQSALDALLEPLVASLRAARFMDRPVERIERIRSGELLDRTTTWPLGTGARIHQPLGVIVRDAEGRVLAKAKATCA